MVIEAKTEAAVAEDDDKEEEFLQAGVLPCNVIEEEGTGDVLLLRWLAMLLCHTEVLKICAMGSAVVVVQVAADEAVVAVSKLVVVWLALGVLVLLLLFWWATDAR